MAGSTSYLLSLVIDDYIFCLCFSRIPAVARHHEQGRAGKDELGTI